MAGVKAPVAELVASIAAAPARCGAVRLTAVDGGAAAGKSTLARLLAARLPRSAVLSLDDLLDGWPGQFGYRDRLHEQVLRPLARGEAARYQRYDWVAGRFAGWVELAGVSDLVVEGVSALWGCQPYWSVGIFCQVARPERERRWAERDGPLQPEWLAWLDAEDRFFATHPPPRQAIVLPG